MEDGDRGGRVEGKGEGLGKDNGHSHCSVVCVCEHGTTTPLTTAMHQEKQQGDRITGPAHIPVFAGFGHWGLALITQLQDRAAPGSPTTQGGLGRCMGHLTSVIHAQPAAFLTRATRCGLSRLLRERARMDTSISFMV